MVFYPLSTIDHMLGSLASLELGTGIRTGKCGVRLAPIRKNIRGICGVDHDMIAVTEILIFGLQLY